VTALPKLTGVTASPSNPGQPRFKVSHNNEEYAGPRIQVVANELFVTILFVLGALGVYWLLEFFPNGKAPILVKAFVVMSDLVLILGATIEFTHAVRTLLRSARDGRTKPSKATSVAPAPDSADRREGQLAGSDEPVPRDSTGTSEAAPNLGYWAVSLRGPGGQRYPQRVVRANIDDPDSFRSHLVGIARLEAPSETDAGEQWIGEYELEVRKVGTEESSPSLVTLRWDASSMAAEPPSPRKPADDGPMAEVFDLQSGRRRA
jgi:hypothetical protein